MPTLVVQDKTNLAAGRGGPGGQGPGGNGFGAGDGRWESAPWSVPPTAYRTGMWMALVAIFMLFAAFTSALVVRRGISNDWVPTALPRILYLNTLILLSSSATLEFSRRSLASHQGDRFKRWLYATLILGSAFIAGQLIAWRELASRGVYLATNPSSSFFYLLTAAHGLHLLGGVFALAFLAIRAPAFAAGAKKPTAVEVTSIYWHFMDGLWVYILLLLMVRS